MKSNHFFIIICLGIFLSMSCKNNSVEKQSEVTSDAIKNEVSKSSYGTTTDGKNVDKYILKNKNGMQVDIITYGGIITSWTAPDKDGKYANIVLGYDSLAQYQRSNPYFGALIGRYGNRIAKGKFTIDGQTYSLPINNDPNSLHGGTTGFDKVLWDVISSETSDNGATLVLGYKSKDMEMGYPGNLDVKVTYALTNEDALDVKYEATTDKKTVVNLTQHTYFNLSGDFKKDILDHEVSIAADKFLPVDATLIPTGKLQDVTNTPFDFRTPKAIGKDIAAKDDQLTKGKGYDHCWALNPVESVSQLRSVSKVLHPSTGRVIEILTNEPGIQFYTGNFLDGTLPMPGGGTYSYRSGFCLETQHYPDSPNQKSFPTTLLEPGQKYSSNTVFKFSKK
jgi:aldose 1-epimerase